LAGFEVSTDGRFSGVHRGFDEQSFRDRMLAQADGITLIDHFEPLDLNSLETDLRSVSLDDALVARLTKLRNETLAHRSGDLVRLSDLTSIAGLGPADVETMLSRARAIVQKYSLLYRRSFVSSKLAGGDDYEYLLSLLRRGFDSLRDEQERQIRADSEHFGQSLNS
jgi:hypothetical protein